MRNVRHCVQDNFLQLINPVFAKSSFNIPFPLFTTVQCFLLFYVNLSKIQQRLVVMFLMRKCKLRTIPSPPSKCRSCTSQLSSQRGRVDSKEVKEPSEICTTFTIALPGPLLGLDNFCTNIGLLVI